MKKFFTLVVCLLSFTCLRAQVFTHTFTSGHIHAVVTDSIHHDSTYCQSFSAVTYAITVDSSFALDTLNIVDTLSGMLLWGSPYVNTSGASPWTITVPVGSGGGWGDADVPVGGGYNHITMWPQKITTRVDTLRYVQYDDSIWVLPCLYGNVSGMVYIDNNANCTFDAGDATLNDWIYPDVLENLSSVVGSIPFPAGGASGSGSYYTETLQQSWMINYTISLPPAFAFIFPMSPCFAGPYAYTSLPQTGVDFPLLCSSNIDVQTYPLSPGRVRLHTSFYMHPYVSNTGCDTISGTMTLIKDSRVIYDASLSTNPADIVLGDTLIWHYEHLTSLSSGGYWNSFVSGIHLTPDTTVIVGDTLCFRIYANVPSADVDPTNNDYTVCIPVVYSYDPNSKEVVPAGTGTNGLLPANTDSLTYTINFQNTGSDVAYDVKIIDTLDSHINAHSLKILGASHNMTPKWLTANIVEFDFPGIMLADSGSNEPASHGQVQFRVSLNAGLPAGTQIRNTGYIYFDANPPVITNTVVNTTSEPSAIHPVAEAKSLKVYPNPATDHLTIEGAAGEISILSLDGSVLIRQHAANGKTTIDISALPSGVYMLKTLNAANTSTIKFTKF